MKWYYADAGRQVGPIPQSDFQALANAGKISSKTLVWHPGMEDWQKYGKVKRSNRAGIDPVTDGETHSPMEAVCSECSEAFSQEEMFRYGNAWVCAGCKLIFVQKLKEGVSLAGEMEYAGFWIRLGAKFIDGIILGAISMFVSFGAGFMMISSFDPSHAFALSMILNVLQIAIAATYTTWFLGRYGATLGKMACKIKVVTADGERVSYARALGRHFAEFISSLILLIGYIMAAFDNQKRTLHDRICNTRVVRK